MDSNQFAQQVKQKYPQYASIPNDQLTQKVLAKYPQYQPMVQQPSYQAGQQPQPFNGLDPAKLIGLYLKLNTKAQDLIGPMVQQRLGMNQMNPLQQSEMAKNYAEAQKAGNPQTEWSPFPGAANGQALEINKVTGEVRPVKGIKGYQPASAMTGSAGPRGAFYSAAAEERLKQIVDPSMASPNTAIGRSVQSSIRVMNGLDLLNQPTVNNTDLNALIGDVDSLVSQASATVEGRKMLQTPNFWQNVQKFKSYASTHPENTPITPGMVNTYRQIFQNLGQFAQGRVFSYIDRNAKMAAKLGSDVFGSQQGYTDYIQSIKGDYDINAQLQKYSGQSTLGTGTQTQGGWGIQKVQ